MVYGLSSFISGTVFPCRGAKKDACVLWRAVSVRVYSRNCVYQNAGNLRLSFAALRSVCGSGVLFRPEYFRYLCGENVCQRSVFDSDFMFGRASDRIDSAAHVIMLSVVYLRRKHRRFLFGVSHVGCAHCLCTLFADTFADRSRPDRSRGDLLRTGVRISILPKGFYSIGQRRAVACSMRCCDMPSGSGIVACVVSSDRESVVKESINRIVAHTAGMKKFISLSLAVAATAGTVFGMGNAAIKASADEGLAPVCKAAYLCDYNSGTQVYAKNETERLPIASMCKIMTLLLSFEAVDRGELSYDEKITVSENASGMGGSQVFLQSNLSYRAEDLMKTVAVCSANDSCVALAERICGSESAFIERMNDRAKELGADNTLFANCTGLPKEPQYSCAKDVSLMLREMLTHEKYYEFSRVWLEDFAHPDGRKTQITNTNKLIRFYDGCDGGKTGYTSEAGFCLAATAKRGDMRLISVMIGAENSKKRFADTKAMFDYCFNLYESKEVLSAGETEMRVSVGGSRIKEIPTVAENSLCVFRRKGTDGEYTVSYEMAEKICAPIIKGCEIGTAILYVNGVEAGRTRLLAGEDAARYNWWDALREGAQNWN